MVELPYFYDLHKTQTAVDGPQTGGPFYNRTQSDDRVESTPDRPRFEVALFSE